MLARQVQVQTKDRGVLLMQSQFQNTPNSFTDTQHTMRHEQIDFVDTYLRFIRTLENIFVAVLCHLEVRTNFNIDVATVAQQQQTIVRRDPRITDCVASNHRREQLPSPIQRELVSAYDCFSLRFFGEPEPARALLILAAPGCWLHVTAERTVNHEFFDTVEQLGVSSWVRDFS
jgi:hypothetical protein